MYLRSQSSSTVVNFEGLDVYDVFVALRSRAMVKHSGWVDLYERSRPFMSKEVIDSYIRDARGKLGWVDRIDGGAVVIKTNFSSFPMLDSYCYNRPEDNGRGSMEAVRDHLLLLLRRKEAEANPDVGVEADPTDRCSTTDAADQV